MTGLAAQPTIDSMRMKIVALRINMFINFDIPVCVKGADYQPRCVIIRPGINLGDNCVNMSLRMVPELSIPIAETIIIPSTASIEVSCKFAGFDCGFYLGQCSWPRGSL